MKREYFIMHLESLHCRNIRTDKNGYSVFKNETTGAKSGVPASDPIAAATACRICATLGINIPDVFKATIPLMDHIDEIKNKINGKADQ